MKIILVRHGEPDLDDCKAKKDAMYGEWLKKYNAAGIRKESRPPEELLEEVRGCRVIFCSDLKRSSESARQLGPYQNILQDKVFREFELPRNRRHWPRLTPGIWSAVFRLLWFAGFSGKSEGFRDARQRIPESAMKLEDMACRHSEVALAGHGLMNRFIGRELRKRGWKNTGGKGSGFWSYSIYMK